MSGLGAHSGSQANAGNDGPLACREKSLLRRIVHRAGDKNDNIERFAGLDLFGQRGRRSVLNNQLVARRALELRNEFFERAGHRPDREHPNFSGLRASAGREQKYRSDHCRGSGPRNFAH